METAWTRLLGLCEGIADCAILTVCFLLGSFVGGVLLGVAPSLVALLGAADQRFVQKSDAGVWRLYWTDYRCRFWRANRAHLMPVLIVLFLIYDYAFADANAPGGIRPLILAATGLGTVVAALAAVHGVRESLADREATYPKAVLLTLRLPWHNVAFATASFALWRVSAIVSGFSMLLLWGVWAWCIVVVGAALDERTSRE